MAPPNSARYRDMTDRLAYEHLLTVTAGQGSDFLDPVEETANNAGAGRFHMRTAQVGYNPIAEMKRGAQATYNAQDSRHVMTQMLGNLRRSGSMIRTMRLRGLGAVDCSTVNPAQWDTAQTDALQALLLSNLGTPEMAANFAFIPASSCWMQWLGTRPIPTDTSAGLAIASALKSNGWLASIDITNPQVAALFAILANVHKLTPEKALKLANCGSGITKAGAWANYAEAWPQTDCMAASWYENPWYLGAGAAVLIGGIWFATRKKGR